MINQNEFSGSRILLVEDEESLAVGLEYNLTEEGYRISLAKDGKQAVEKFLSGSYEMIILDIMLPFVDGFEVARRMREKDPQIPILMLTAKRGLKDRLKGLGIGADDYMTKPFHLEELLLRVKGMLRRKNWYKTKTDENPVFHFGNHTVNFSKLTCQSGTNEFRLTQHEAMLLKYLSEHQDRIVSRQELLENVWQIRSEIETRTVDIFIVRLRKYFESDPKNPKYFLSVRSAGYLFHTGTKP